MNVSFFVDWLSVVFPFNWLIKDVGTSPLLLEVARRMSGIVEFPFGQWKGSKPHNGYTLAWKDSDTGVVVEVAPNRPDMGIHVLFTGQTLQRVGWMQAVWWANSHGGRCTRIDLTMDIKGLPVDIPMMYAALEAGLYTTKSRKRTLVSGTDGSTLYIGSRTSERMMRIYDKAAERGVDGSGGWTRAEIEMKSTAAAWTMTAIEEAGEDLMRHEFSRFMQSDRDSWWASVVGNAKVGEFQQSEKKRSDTERWLEGDVARILAKAIIRDVSMGERFATAVNQWLEELEPNSSNAGIDARL